MQTGKRCSGLSTGGGWGCLPATCPPPSPPTAAIPTHHCSAYQEIMPPLSVRTRTSATQVTRAVLLHLVLPPPALKGLTWSLKGRVACERSCPALPHPLGQQKARRASHRYSESDSTAPRQQSFRSAGKPAARLSLQDNSTLSAWD